MYDKLNLKVPGLAVLICEGGVPSLEVSLKLPGSDRFVLAYMPPPLPPSAVSPFLALVSAALLKVSAPWPCSHPAPPAHYDSPAGDSSR